MIRSWLRSILVSCIAIMPIGFIFEIISDLQKKKFRQNPKNKDQFISSGLWTWSQHPNYFGEIVLWTGIAIIAAPVLAGWQLVTLISPVFVFFLLTRVSGVRLLDIGAKERWGENHDYLTYIAKTPVLFLNPFLSLVSVNFFCVISRCNDE